jgi:hypothetical protein
VYSILLLHHPLAYDSKPPNRKSSNQPRKIMILSYKSIEITSEGIILLCPPLISISRGEKEIPYTIELRVDKNPPLNLKNSTFNLK